VEELSPTKTPSSPAEWVKDIRNSQKVVENNRLGEGSSNPVSIIIFNNLIRNDFLKTDFPKKFQSDRLENQLQLFIESRFFKKNSDLYFSDRPRLLELPWINNFHFFTLKNNVKDFPSLSKNLVSKKINFLFKKNTKDPGIRR
jgi:hypothetical protein